MSIRTAPCCDGRTAYLAELLSKEVIDLAMSVPQSTLDLLVDGESEVSEKNIFTSGPIATVPYRIVSHAWDRAVATFLGR